MSEQTQPLELESIDAPPVWTSPAVRFATFLAIVIPFVGVIVAPFALWGIGFHWADLGLLLSFYFLTSLGITAGYHRLLVHRSFDTYAWVKFIFVVLGSMAIEGSIFQWVATHRRHHQYSDTTDDPHSPIHEGSGLLGFIRGFWHSHIGWFFDSNPANMERYIQDLKASRTLRIADALFPLWVVLGLAIPAALGGVLTMSWAGALTGLIWGGLVRVFLVHHVTWSVNSACHLWGGRPFRSKDESRNNFLFGVLALGEGWHNTHHAFPTSARHGLRWWELDVSWLVIRTLAFCGLTWNIKLPSREAQLREMRS